MPTTRGFTLLEMAVTLAIVSILLGGLLLTLGAQQDVTRERETRQLLNQAREALYGFAVREGRLPCPAAPGAAAGTERTAIDAGCTGGAAALHGVLPWATLGLPEGDDWGRRFTYTVTAEFARTAIAATPRTTGQFACGTTPPAVAPTQSAFALCTPGTITVGRRGGAPSLINDAPAVIVSHGPNGFGGYTVGGSQVPASADANELENSDADFVFRDDVRGDTYDDMVTWVVPSILMNRMLQAGKLP